MKLANFFPAPGEAEHVVEVDAVPALQLRLVELEDAGGLAVAALEAASRELAVAPRVEARVLRRGDAALDGRLGRKRVIQRRFNVAVPRARVPKKDVHVRDRSER